MAEVDTIYVIPASHTDVGFNAPPSEIAEKASRTTDAAIAQATKDPDYVWNFETFWQLQGWLDRHPDPAPVVELLHSGRFGLSASYVNTHAALLSAWALDWQFRMPAEWAEQQGLKLDWAIIDDVPGEPIDLPKYMNAHSVRYLAMGVNQSLTLPLPLEICNTPFWWESPDGARVLIWISRDAYPEAYTEYGLDPDTARFFNSKEFKQGTQLEIMRHGIERMMKRYEKEKYPYDAVLALHAFDNWGPESSFKLPDAMRLWNNSGSKPKIIISTPREFFQHIEKQYPAKLPVRRGGFGGQWEGARNAIPTAIARARAEEKRLRAIPDPSRADVARVLTFWDHGVGMGTPWPDLLTRQQILQHNKEQYGFTEKWPQPPPPPRQGKILNDFGKGKQKPFRPNGLYLMESAFFKSGFSPLDPEAWRLGQAEQLDDGTIRARHRIDRLALPKEAHVVWLWKFPDGDPKAPITIKTASGEMRWPDDGLAGYYPGHWIAPEFFRIGSTEFRPQGPYLFFRLEQYPGWVFGQVLDQVLDAEYKGKKKGQMTFEEAYPGESRLYEFVIDVKSE